jgi:hypothetical protein
MKLVLTVIPPDVRNELSQYNRTIGWYDKGSWDQVFVYDIPDIVSLMRYQLMYNQYIPSGGVLMENSNDTQAQLRERLRGFMAKS